MNPTPFITTPRLSVFPLTPGDDRFMLELLNTEGWIRFIGNRNVNSQKDAAQYIERILANANISYWVVQLKENEKSVGLVSYIKRDYLEHNDIGFAFLPEFSSKGYAFEAANMVLHKLFEEANTRRILATTVPTNSHSIILLRKLGFEFEKEIEVENEALHVYGLSGNRLLQ